MDRLNIYNPYESKETNHEDQLTRAYLILLKYSFHAFFAFFDYCRDKFELENKKHSLSLLECMEKDWTIDTQRGNPEIETDYLLSILITDKNIKNESPISPSDRNARYDGIITFGSKLTMIIENKPKSDYVWFDQLNPSKQNLSEDTIVYEESVVLEWKEIIKHLNSLKSVSTISGYEKIMFDDFLSFVDKKFSYLNPYDYFSLCKNDKSLLGRRIENILKSIVRGSIEIKYHQGWGYYIDAPFEQITKIGLILYDDLGKKNDWSLGLEFHFGQTQNQARSLYNSDINISNLEMFDDCEWYPVFHVSFMSTTLVTFESPSSISIKEYTDYWINKNKKDPICQLGRDKVKGYLDSLAKDNIIVYDTDKQKEMDDVFFATERQSLNICPEFYLVFYIPAQTAIEKDNKTGELKELISKKIKEGLSIVNLKWEEILK